MKYTKYITARVNVDVNKHLDVAEDALEDIKGALLELDCVSRVHTLEGNDRRQEGINKAKEHDIKVIERHATPETAGICATMLMWIYRDWGHPVASVEFTVEDGRVKFTPLFDTKRD